MLKLLWQEVHTRSISEAMKFITENVSNNYVLKPTSMSMSLVHI